MKHHYKLDYSILSDQQIVEKILAEPHDEEAAAYISKHLKKKYETGEPDKNTTISKWELS